MYSKHKQKFGLNRDIGINVYAGLNIIEQQENVIKDSFINIFSPDEVYDYTNLQIYNGGAADSLYALLDFDLSDIAGKTIIAAVLSMYADELTLSTGLGFKRITETWVESTVTWNTRPAIADTVYSLHYPSLGVGYKYLDIKTLVQSVADGEGYYGIWIYVANPVLDYRWCQFSSSEAENVPSLKLIYI